MTALELKELLDKLIAEGHEKKDAIYVNEGVTFSIKGYVIEENKIRFW